MTAEQERAAPSMASFRRQITNCDAKAIFTSKGDALKYADRHNYQQRAYRCVICGDWHLTSQTGRVQEF